MSFPAGHPESFEAYRAIVAPMFELQPLASGTPFSAETEVYCLTDLVFSRAACSGSSYTRTNEMIAHSDGDGILVLIYQKNSFTFEANGSTVEVAPHEVAFFDLRRPLKLRADEVDNLSLLVSRRRLETLAPNIENIHGFVLRSGTLCQLLLSHLRSMHNIAHAISVSESQSVSDATIHLVASCMVEASRHTVAATNFGSASLAEIKDAIERQLDQPDFCPQSLVEQFGLSRATLYRMFEPLGGVKAYINERRLQYAFRLMTDPKAPSVRIKQLAYKLGYGHPSAFSRAFRSLFGVSPSQVRAKEAYPDRSNDKPWKLAPEAEPYIDADQ